MTKNFIKKIKGVHPSSRILSTFISVQSTDLVIATLRLIKQKKKTIIISLQTSQSTIETPFFYSNNILQVFSFPRMYTKRILSETFILFLYLFLELYSFYNSTLKEGSRKFLILATILRQSEKKIGIFNKDN